MLWSAAAAPPIQTWTGQDGSIQEAVLVRFDWDNKLLVLQDPTGGEPQMYYARNLDLPGKVQLFASRAYRSALSSNYEAIRSEEYFQIRQKELSSLSVLMLSSYVVSFFGISWLLVGWAVPGASAGKAFIGILFVTALTVGAAYGAVEMLARAPGSEKEVLIAAGICHFVVFVLSALLLFRARFGRTLGWYVLHWAAAILLPITLLMTGLAAQVYKAEGTVSLKAADKYLMETWFEPMGLL